MSDTMQVALIITATIVLLPFFIWIGTLIGSWLADWTIDRPNKGGW